MDKKWYQSKGVWGGLIAVLAAVAGAFGIDIDADAREVLAESAVVIAGGIGGIIGVYGRYKADGRIK